MRILRFASVSVHTTFASRWADGGITSFPCLPHCNFYSRLLSFVLVLLSAFLLFIVYFFGSLVLLTFLFSYSASPLGKIPHAIRKLKLHEMLFTRVYFFTPHPPLPPFWRIPNFIYLYTHVHNLSLFFAPFPSSSPALVMRIPKLDPAGH